MLLIESAFGRADVINDIDELDVLHGGGGAAEAISFSFFSKKGVPAELKTKAPDSFLGQAIVINYRSPHSADFTKSYVYEAVLSPPKYSENGSPPKQLLNNFVCSDGEFRCSVRDIEFTIRAIYYAQQNAETHVCAHACLRMILNTMSEQSSFVTGASINRFLGRTPSNQGLTLTEVYNVITNVGKFGVDLVDCEKMDAKIFISILASTIESGHLALVVFTTGHGTEHVVTVYGHTRNSDEWHPQALPMYAGAPSAPYFMSSSWIDHFLIHDDNLGPYFSLGQRALLSEPDVKARWLISVRRSSPALRSIGAENYAAIHLSNSLSSFVPLGQGRWFEYMTRAQRRYVLRTTLVTKARYLDHLRESVGHDNSRMVENELSVFDNLPDEFWMVELSLPSLFTGNRTKLGEVLISTEAPTVVLPLPLAFRLPSLVLIKSSTGKLVPSPAGLVSHALMIQARVHTNEW